MTESLAWTCRCGAWCWNHHTNCAACGTEKPAPPPQEPPSDVARTEPPWRMEWDTAKSIEGLLHEARHAAVLWELRRRLGEVLDEQERDTAFLDGAEWTPEQLDALKRRRGTYAR